MQIGQKMEAGDCPTSNMNAMENYLLSQTLTDKKIKRVWQGIGVSKLVNYFVLLFSIEYTKKKKVMGDFNSILIQGNISC